MRGHNLLIFKLLLATGSIPFVPYVKGTENKENCYTFLNMKSSCDIKTVADKNTDAVIIGGGLIGLKAAEGLSKICKSVTVCELSNRLLPTILDKPAGDLIGKHIKEHGINYYTENTVAEALSEGNKITGVILKDGTRLNCSMLVMAVGVRPNIELAKQIGADIGRGIKTDNRQMTSIPDVYAAGDCTESIDILDNSVKIMALWPNAVMQGKTAGNAMAGGDKRFDGAFAMNAIDFFGLHIVTCGLINASEEDGYISTITTGDMRYRKFVIKDNKLKGYILIGDINRAGIYTDLIRKGIPLNTVKWDNSAPISDFMFNPIQRKKRFGYYPPDMENAQELCPDMDEIADIIVNQEISENDSASS